MSIQELEKIIKGANGHAGLAEDVRTLDREMAYLKKKVRDIDRKLFVIILILTAFFGTDIMISVIP